MTFATSVSPVDASTFDWAAPAGAAEEARRVVEAATAADGRSPLNEATLLSLRHHGLAASTLLVAHQDTTVAGFALVSESAGGGVEVNLVVAPASRAHGVGSSLAAAVLSAFPATAIATWSHGNHPAAAALASSHGFDRARDLWIMRRPLTGLPPARDIEHIDVRPFRPGHDEDALLAVNAAAFAHHAEQGEMTREDLDERMSEAWFDPAGFFLAWSPDRDLLGFHWTKVHPATSIGSFGEVYVVGVSPSAQGTGLGGMLTLTGLRHLASLGLDEVILYVESDNAPAVAVYQRLGFTHADADTDVMYAR